MHPKAKLLRCCLITGCYIFCSIQLNAQPSHWINSDMGGGGAVYAPSINPFNESEMYLSCDMGVMFHSMDSAKNWNTLHFNTLSGNRNSEVQFTGNTSIRYVLRQSNTSTQYVPHISTDTGTTWVPIPVPGIGQFGAFRLYAHPQQSNIIIVSGTDKLFFSKTSGSNYSTIYTAPAGAFHLAGVFFDGNNIYICTNKGLLGIDVNGNSIQAYSTHASMGASTSQEHFVSFSGARQGSTLRFIAVSITSASFSVRTYASDVTNFTALYRMDFTTGASWSNITSNFKYGAPSNKAYNIAMKPDDTSTFYIGGQAKVPDAVNGILLGTVFKTTDGGASFSNIFLNGGYTSNANINTGWQGTAAASANWIGHTWNSINTTEGLTVSRNNINYIARSDKSNLYISDDGGITWKQRYLNFTEHTMGTLIQKNDYFKDNGLQTTVCYWMTWMDSLNMYASFADMLAIRSDNGGNSWSFNFSGLDTSRIGDASMIIRHPDGTLYAATGDVPGSNGDYSDVRASNPLFSRGRLCKSTDNGLTWTMLHSFPRAVTSVAINPQNLQQLYFTVASEKGGIGGIYKMLNRTDPSSTIPIPSPPGTENRPGQVFVLKDGSLLAGYSARDVSTTANPSYSYVNSSGVFYSANDGVNWTSNNPQGMTYDVRSITIDPNDNSDSTWWTCVGPNKDTSSTVPGNFEGVYKTVNRGNSWTKIISSKKSISCTFHPVNPNEMYLCTQDEGLFYFTGTNTALPSMNFVNSYPFKYPQRVFFNPYNKDEVWVTSVGNGLKKGYTSCIVNSWTGLISSAWEDPRNWGCGAIPDSNSIVYISSTAPNFPVVRSIAACQKIFLNQGSGITIKQNYQLQVKGQ